MNGFEEGLARYWTPEQLEKIRSYRVGIAGAGGLGSNCAFNLVRSGFQDLLIIDDDHVEPSNLNRQFYFLHQLGQPKVEALKANLLAINPDLRLTIRQARIERENIQELFADCDIVVEAFDQAAYKRLIIEEFLDSPKFLVAASGLAGWGNSDAIKVHRVNDTFVLVGDLVTEATELCPPFSPRVNIAAAKQADVILEYVLGVGV
ncbi:MAG: sulfur carrier protein ThiS adenylyltransferase ThiF [Limnochordia bacterium]|jgi:sulfur carrier protein ThiS adenylyltransferase